MILVDVPDRVNTELNVAVDPFVRSAGIRFSAIGVVDKSGGVPRLERVEEETFLLTPVKEVVTGHMPRNNALRVCSRWGNNLRDILADGLFRGYLLAREQAVTVLAFRDFVSDERACTEHAITTSLAALMGAAPFANTGLALSRQAQTKTGLWGAADC